MIPPTFHPGDSLRTFRPLARRRGFSLLEALIGLALASVIATMAFTIVRAQTRSLRTDEMSMELSQDTRFISTFLGHAIRNAGLGTSGAVAGPLGASTSSRPSAIAVNSTLPALMAWDSSSEADAIAVVYMDPDLMMTTDGRTLPTCSSTSLSFDMTAPLDYDDKIVRYTAGDYLMCYDFAPSGGSRSFLWQISTSGNATTGRVGVTAANAFTDFNTACGTGGNLPVSMTCSVARIQTFYVDSRNDGIGPGTPEVPVLMMDTNFTYPSGAAADDIPLVTGVEDLQFAYCLDSSDCSLSTTWTNDPFSSATVSAANVKMVRMTAVVRTDRTDKNGSTNRSSRPTVENRTGSTTADGYSRQVITNRFLLRNLGGATGN